MPTMNEQQRELARHALGLPNIADAPAPQLAEQRKARA